MRQRYSMEQLATIFGELLEMSEIARQEWFAKTELHADDRQQLGRMLRADADAEPGFLDESAVAHAQALTCEQDRDIEPSGLVGQQFGPFRLTRLLGQGGMATVFLAERSGADFEQIVAVKLLRRGLFSAMEQKLFRRERRLLAQLNHPNIAHLIDGGVTEAGIPYLVMEYVDGSRLDQHVVEHRLDLRARLQLFITACRAVEAAHQALIVHRDIKPSNILVTREGVPKLLDFGIAKLLPEDSAGDSPYRTLTAALTPGYAAPEQMTGSPVTTATDVYALGVVLHELLTGQRPKDTDTVIASNAIDIAITSEPGTLPMQASVLKRILRGDLDNIIARALSVEPDRRYPTAAALVDDLERYLQGRPVHAHPRSRWYVMRKFVRRHRAAAAITLTLSLAVFGSLGVALWQANSARVEAHRANVVRDFLLELLDTAKANLPPDQQPSPRTLANKAAERLAADATLPDLTRADLLFTLGQVSQSAGAYDQAANMLEQAAQIRFSILGPLHDDYLSTLLQMAVVRGQQGHYSDARKLLQRVLPTMRQQDSLGLVHALAACVETEVGAGRIDAAFACQNEETQAANRVLDPRSAEAILSRLRLGDLLGAAERSREAIAVLEPALADWRESGQSSEQSFYLNSLANLAVAHYALGEIDIAIPIFEQVLAGRRTVLPAGHPEIANSVASLGSVLMAVMRYDEADALLKESLRMTRRSLGDAHPKVVFRLIALATNARRRNRTEEAIEYAREAVASCAVMEIASSSACAHAQQTLSESVRDVDASESLRYIDAALARFQTQYQEPHTVIAVAIHSRAATLLKLMRLDDALADSDAAIAMFDAAHAGQSADSLIAKQTRAAILNRFGRNAEALNVIDAVTVDWRKRFGLRKDRFLSMLETRARIHLSLGDRAAARASAQEALALNVDESIVSSEVVVFLKSAARAD